MAVKTLPPSVAEVLGEEASQDLLLWFQDQFTSAAEAGVQVSDFIARQKVNVLMLEQVSNLLLAGTPQLVKDEVRGWLWRVPVELTFPSRGRVGQVAFVDVDSRYGFVYYDTNTVENIRQQTQHLTHHMLQSQPYGTPSFAVNRLSRVGFQVDYREWSITDLFTALTNQLLLIVLFAQVSWNIGMKMLPMRWLLWAVSKNIVFGFMIPCSLKGQ